MTDKNRHPDADRQYVDEHIDETLETCSNLELVEQASALLRYLRSGAPIAHIATAVGALVYVVCPIDLIPDVIPVVGWLDDVAVVAGAVAALGSALERFLDEEQGAG